MTTARLEVHAYWDQESGRWWAESEDIPGLVTEAATFEALIANIRALIPDLVALNGLPKDRGELPISVMAETTPASRENLDIACQRQYMTSKFTVITDIYLI